MDAPIIPLSSTAAQSNATKLIVLFHWVGSSAPAYRSIARALEPNGFTSIAINLPGRAGSSKVIKDTLKNVDEVADWIVSSLLTNISKYNPRNLPIYFFGHSFGGLLVYETIRRIQSNTLYHIILPKAIIISAVQSPLALTLKNYDKSIDKHYQLNDTNLIQYIKNIDGLPNNLPIEFLERALPTIKSDYELFENYSFTSSIDLLLDKPHIITIPLLILSANNDKTVNLSSMNSWLMYSSCQCNNQPIANNLLSYLGSNNKLNNEILEFNCTCGKYKHNIINGTHFYLIDKEGISLLVSIISSYVSSLSE